MGRKKKYNKVNNELEFYFYFVIDTIDIFDESKSKKIQSHSMNKAKTQEEAENNIRLVYEQMNLPIFNITLQKKTLLDGQEV